MHTAREMGEDPCMQGWDALVNYSKVTRLMLPTALVLFKASPKSSETLTCWLLGRPKIKWYYLRLLGMAWLILLMY